MLSTYDYKGWFEDIADLPPLLQLKDDEEVKEGKEIKI